MKKFLKFSPLCLLVILGLFIHISNTRFVNEALAKGLEVKNSLDLEKTYGIVLKKSVQASQKEQKSAEQSVKKANILLQAEGSGPNYDVNPSDGTDFKEVYKDSLFIGDSISNGLMYYKHVKAENVLADIGQDLKKSLNSIDKITKKNPKYIYIMLGMNDSIYVDDVNVFIERYKSLISQINQNLPKTKVAITSILPADSSNKKAMARINNQRISAYNAGLADLANEFGIPFIDLRPYLKAHPDFYEGDGIHLNRYFYRYWLKFIQENYKEA